MPSKKRKYLWCTMGRPLPELRRLIRLRENSSRRTGRKARRSLWTLASGLSRTLVIPSRRGSIKMYFRPKGPRRARCHKEEIKSSQS